MFIVCLNHSKWKHITLIERRWWLTERKSTFFPCLECRSDKLEHCTLRFSKSFYVCDKYTTCKYTLNNQSVIDECKYCYFPLLIAENTIRGVKLFCANKRYTQTSNDKKDDNND